MADSNPTTQLIDSRIVSLLGLQDDLELSHEDYFRSLKEAALAARMSGGKFSSEEVSLITEELKRVRKEDKNIKFQTEKKKVKAKPKKQKVSKKNTSTPPKTTAPKPNTKVTSLSTFVQKEPKSTVAEPQSPPQATPTTPLLPQPKKKTVEVKEKKQKIKKEGCCEVLGKKLTKIDSTLGSIFSTLKDQFSLRKKDSERERRGREKSGRDDAENKLEKGSGIKEIVNTAKNLLSPFQDLFDRIKRFIVFTLLGKAFTMFMDWMKDPKNRQTFNTIVKFLTDHWVLIVGSYLLFGTKLGSFARTIGKLVVKLAVKAVLATGKLIAVLAKSKWGRVALAAGAVTAGAVAISQSGKKKDDKQDVESYADGGIIGGLGKALKFTPLGMAFEAGKFGAKALGSGAKAVGKAASGTANLLGKGLKNTLDIATLPLTIGFKGLAGASEFLMNGLKSLDLFKLLAGPIQDITKKGGDKDPKLQAAGGIPGLIGTIVQKTSEGVGKNVKSSKESKKKDNSKEGPGYAKGGLVSKLPMGLMGAAAAVPGLGALAPFAPLLAPLLQSKKIGGDHGLPVSGAGKDDRLLKLRTGDAILTEKDQKQLSSGNFLEKFGGPMGAMASFFSGKKSGEETVVAAKKGEAVVTQEDQLSIFEKTGISIPSLLSGRKPNKVSSDQLKAKGGKRLPGFFNGGVVEGFAGGGIVGGDAAYANQRYQELLQTTKKSTIDSYNKKYGEGAYEKKLLAKLNKIHTGPDKSTKLKLPPVKTNDAYMKSVKERAGKGSSTLTVNGLRIFGAGKVLDKIKDVKTPDIKIEDIANKAQSKIKKLAAATKLGEMSAEEKADYEQAIAKEKVERDKILSRSKQKRSSDEGARKAFGDIFENPNLKNPLHEKVAFGDMTYEQFKKVYYGKQSKAPAKGNAGYTPFKSKFAGARDAAHAKAKNISGESKKGFGFGSALKKAGGFALNSVKTGLEYSPLGLSLKLGKRGLDTLKSVGASVGGWMQGRFNQVSKDVKTPKPKATPFTGVKSSDFYRANSQAKEQSLSKLSSQQRLNKLSFADANRSSRGVRFDAESKARGQEVKGRGGAWGQISRGWMNAFGSDKTRANIQAQDKASEARVRQAGAASIGRYYSSSDGKYYKDYDAAQKARQARLAAGPKPAAPKPQVAGGGMGGGRGSGSNPGQTNQSVRIPGARTVSNVFSSIRSSFSAANKVPTTSKPTNQRGGIKPPAPKPPAPAPKPQVAGGGMGGRRGSGIKKKEGGGLVENDAPFGLQNLFKNFKTYDVFKNSKYSFNLNDSFKNYFDTNRNKQLSKSTNANAVKGPNPFGPNLGLNLKPIKTNYQLSKTSNKNLVKTAFDSKTNLNIQRPKKQSISDTLKELREMRARSLDRQGNTLGALNVRASNYNFPKIDTSKLKIDPKKAYGSNLNLTKDSKNLVKTAFNPNINLNLQKPKRESIADTLKELREMRAKSLERQGDALGALGVRASNYNLPKIDASKLNVDPKKAYGSNLNIITPQTNNLPKFELPKSTPNIAASFKPAAPIAPPSPPVEKKVGGGFVKLQGGGDWRTMLQTLYQRGNDYQIPQSTDASFADYMAPPINKFQSGMQSLGERARNVFSPITNLFSNKQNQPATPDAPPPPIVATQIPAPAPVAPPPPVPVAPLAPTPATQVATQPKPISTPSASLAPVKKSIMQQQADELRAMRANSLERQGKSADAYGLRAFGTGKDFSSSFFAKGNVMENTGINMPGGTADRQLTALQPGEYVIPKQTVNAFGGASFFDSMVAKTDSDSNAAKLGAKNKSNVGGGIKPYPINNSKKPQITNLGSAKEARSGAQLSKGSTPNGASKEIFFGATCSEGSAPSERQRIMDLLGVNS